MEVTNSAGLTLTGVEFVIGYDPNVLRIANPARDVRLAKGFLPDRYELVFHVDHAAGRLTGVLVTDTPDDFAFARSATSVDQFHARVNEWRTNRDRPAARQRQHHAVHRRERRQRALVPPRPAWRTTASSTESI